MTLLVFGVDGDDVPGAFLDDRPVPLGDSLFCFIEEPVDLPLKALAGHDGGMVIPL